MLLTRARLRRDRGLAPLAPLLMPDADGGRAGATHRLVWTLFADVPERRRDFLWREEEPGRFLLLSARPPEDAAGLFTLDASKPFAPRLATGDRLAFMLRANPVVTSSAGKGKRGKRHGIVAAALRDVHAEARSEQRRMLVEQAGRDWLMRQGKAAGFVLLGPLAVDGDDWRRIPRAGQRDIHFNVLDFAGHVEVGDPACFLAALARGFGRAKAFGCGLMLIRRA